MKAAAPIQGGLPWYEVDGKIYNQSNALLNVIAAENGYQSDDPWVQYESDWVAEVFFEHAKTEMVRPIVQGADATEEARAKSLELVCTMLDIFEERFKDGRKYVAGN